MKHRKIFLLSSFILFFLILQTATIFAADKVTDQSTYPQKIVSLGPINTENVFLLGAGDRIVGSTVYCVRPEEAKSSPKVGSVMQFSMEKVIALQPDLVLATAFTNPQQLQKLEKLGFTVVRFDQPRSFEQSCEQLIELGTMLGLEDRAKAIATSMRGKVGAIKRRVASLEKPKVFYQIGTAPLHGATRNTFSDDYIMLSGGINITREQDSGKTNREKVLAENPDVIIIAIMGSESGIAGKEKKAWQHFTSIQAVQDNRVHIISPDLACSPSPESFVEALQVICSFIHPELNLDHQ